MTYERTKKIIEELEALKAKHGGTGVERLEHSGTMITGAGIPIYRLLMFRQGLIAEARGMKLWRGPKATTILRRQYGLKGNREALLRQVNEILEAVRPK